MGGRATKLAAAPTVVELQDFTFESKIIGTSLAGAVLCAGWWAWRRCTHKNGKDTEAATGLKSHNVAAVVSLMLFLVACTYSSTVRQFFSADAVPVALVLGAAVLVPLSFTSILSSTETADPAKPTLPGTAATALLIKQRRSVFPKDYNGAAVPRAVIERALEAANWAPTHGKTEPWRFVVFAGPDRIMELETAKQKATEEVMKDTPEKLAAAIEKMEKKRKDVLKERVPQLVDSLNMPLTRTRGWTLDLDP